jgi:two-component system, cell cycle sensor histidine kinase and response regulator CckA
MLEEDMPVFGIQPPGLLQTVFEDIGTAVAVVDRQEHIVFANRPALELFRVDKTDPLPTFRNWRHNYRFENCLGNEIALEDSAVLRALKGNRTEAQEIRLILENGEEKWLLVWAYPFSVAGLSGALAIIVDQSKEVKLRQATSQLQRLETLGTLSAGLAHDFNTILDTISLNAQLALEEAGEMKDCRPRIKEISDATKRASSLIGRLLQFSRSQDSKLQDVQMNDVIRAVLRLLRPLFRHTLQVKTNLPEDLPTIQANRTQMEQMLANLIINAMDAMPDRGQLTISTERGTPHPNEGNSGWITLIVSDTGVGIPQHLKEAIFEPFFSTKPPGKGTGLGLFTVKGIVRQLNGSIEVRSTPGAGAAFVISLPTPTAQYPRTLSDRPSISVSNDR